MPANIAARPYYTLLIREDGRWGPQFGDYDRRVVNEERRDSYEDTKSEDWMVVVTIGDRREIDALVAALNRSLVEAR